MFVFTGFDYIQAFLNIGKIKFVEVAMEDNRFKECMKANALEELSLEISERHSCVMCMHNQCEKSQIS